MDRRRFSAAGALGLVGLARKSGSGPAGGFVDSSHTAGHRLRDRGAFPAVRQEVRAPVVIVGGGIAGLCAAWRLERRGFRDYVILELEREAGGNARWGENDITPFPWAAHYVPVPARHNRLLRELFADLGVWKDGQWEERYLCHAPQERLFLHGKWQEGLEPEVGATRRDREQIERFRERMREFEESGEFDLPADKGKRERRDLDRISMLDWLRGNGFDSPYLDWMVDYSCRDDFGARAGETSAWAGIHYFASRGDQDDRGPLTWPEGNGWIARRLIARCGERLRPGSFVHGLKRRGRGWEVEAAGVRYLAPVVIFAAPAFLLPYLMEDAPVLGAEYSPWLVANLTLEGWPEERGTPVAWDNVVYRSPALGYVVATHQSLRTRVNRTVWTYYWALADGRPADNRRLLLERSWAEWVELILRDLEQPHRDIRRLVSRIDIMRLGHAMVRPAPGYLFSEARERMARQGGPFIAAHSDVSGLPLFEEAHYRGVAAADRALRYLGRG